jgi:hypothetical protein
VLAVLGEACSDLLRKLARRCKNECPGTITAGLCIHAALHQKIEQGQAEGGCFPRARAGAAQHVAAGHDAMADEKSAEAITELAICFHLKASIVDRSRRDACFLRTRHIIIRACSRLLLLLQIVYKLMPIRRMQAASC